MSNYKRLFIQNSYLFLTITTNYRRPVLVNNIQLLRESFKRAKKIYKFDLHACVILPDHMHLILIPEKIQEYPKIIRAIKYNFSERFNDGGIAILPYEKKQNSRAGLQSCRRTIWQRRYYEHTIRDENDLHRHLDYIHYNPVKHGLVQNVKDWEFSSFDKFVQMKNYEKNWGSDKDIENVKDLDYE